MDRYTIRKVLNNNVVIAEYLGEELILIGKGIGFNTSKNKYIPFDKVENIFSKRVSDDENYNRILENINSEIVGISEEIITSWESKLGTKLNSGIHVSLPDSHSDQSQGYQLVPHTVDEYQNRVSLRVSRKSLGFPFPFLTHVPDTCDNQVG